VKRIVVAHRAELACEPATWKDRGRKYDLVIDLVSQKVTTTPGKIRKSGCCRRRGPRAMPGRVGTSGGW